MARKVKLTIKVPENYCEQTRRFMKNVLKELNSRDDINPLLMEGVVTMLMNCYETNQKASRDLREADEVTTNATRDGSKQAHPAVSIQLKSNQQVLALMKELGLTVKSRKVLDAVEVGNDQLSLFEKEFSEE